MGFPRICSALFHRLSLHRGRAVNCLVPATENWFNSGPFRGRVLVENVALGQIFSASASGFPCQYHCDSVPYLNLIYMSQTL
jgi:hypothetical protein